MCNLRIVRPPTNIPNDNDVIQQLKNICVNVTGFHFSPFTMAVIYDLLFVGTVVRPVKRSAIMNGLRVERDICC